MDDTFDPVAAWTWLGSPDPDGSDATVAETLGVGDEDMFGYSGWTGDVLMSGYTFVDPLEELVAEASSAGVLNLPVSLWITYDPSDGYNGALITVDLPSGLRIASTHLALKHLTRDHHATGVDAAVAVLQAVAYEAEQLIEQAHLNVDVSS